MSFNFRQHKYRAKKTIVDGIVFHSKKEAKRWSELKLLLEIGEIKDLRRQVRYTLCGQRGKVCAYVADFVYRKQVMDCMDGSILPYDRDTVEDVKGFLTPLAKLKLKLFEDNYGFPVTLVK